jgi:hypothetical protein
MILYFRRSRTGKANRRPCTYCGRVLYLVQQDGQIVAR